MKQIIHAVQIHVPPASVFNAITTEVGLSGWWTKRVTVEEEVGGVICFTFAGDFNPRMKQVVLDQDRKAVWQCIGGHANWMDNTFTFTLTERNGETMLIFSQDYARELTDEVYGIYNFNWGYYLNSLKRFCETGEGVPFDPA